MTKDTSTSLIGTIIADRYCILRSIGEGGMGQVYEAEHIRMKRRSAIKVMRPVLVGDSEALLRFTREAENASKLSHPNVASIFDFGETEDGIVYLAMEFIDGESLHEVLFREKAMHPAVAADVISQSADALQAAHDLGILHRDLKPDNLMLTTRPDGTYLVKLVDFGIARAMDSKATRVTRTGFAVGTPDYMSPEQLAGDVLDARSDEYALALVAFIMLTGTEAFASSTGKDSFIMRLTSRPRRLADVRPDIDWPVMLQSVFDRALAPDAGDRYPTIAEFADEFANAITTMSLTETSEMYRRALAGRGIGVARRTPSSPSVPTAKTVEKQKTQVRAAEPVRPQPQVARPVRKPRRSYRRRPLPSFFVIGIIIYAVYWYGAQQSGGTMRRMSNRIGSVSRAIAGPLMPYFDRIRRSATVPSKSGDPATSPVNSPDANKAAAKPEATGDKPPVMPASTPPTTPVVVPPATPPENPPVAPPMKPPVIPPDTMVRPHDL